MSSTARTANPGGRIAAAALLCCLATACASTPALPPHPPKHVYNREEKTTPATVNSLWVDGASLYEDSRARRLNDLVTIKVVESITGSGTADTNTSRDSSVDASVGKFFGVKPDVTGIDFFGRGKTFSPDMQGSMKNAFKGSGQTTREGKLVGTITARVVEVMPNGNLVIESRKEITINNERQILVLRGMIRPDDVAKDNTVSSGQVADAEVFFVGDGIVQEKQKPGWLMSLLDKAWPF